MHTSGSEHESSFMIRLMRESGSSCRGIVFELAPFCASSFCALTCSVSRVSHKWFIRSTCDWSFGGSEVGSTLFLDVLSGSSTRWLGTVALGARKLTNVLGSAGRRPPSSPKVGMATRVADGGRGSRSVGVTMRLGVLCCTARCEIKKLALVPFGRYGRLLASRFVRSSRPMWLLSSIIT